MKCSYLSCGSSSAGHVKHLVIRRLCNGCHLNVGSGTEYCRNGRTVHSMAEITGPRRLPFIGTAWTYWPPFGSDNLMKLHECYREKYLKYGPIVREDVFGKFVISVFDPVDFEKVFRNEGRYPKRISHEMLLAIRRERSEMYHSGGLVPTNGEEWEKLRKSYQQEINRIDVIAQYLSGLEIASRQFLNYLKESRNEEGVIPKLLYKMHEWALESVCLTILDTRLDDFKPTRNVLSRRLIDGANAALKALGDSEYSLMWRYVRTADWKTLAENDLLFYDFARMQVERKLKMMKDGLKEDGSGESVLKKYLLNTNNDLRDIITTTSDLIFTGLLTTAVSTAYILYHLSANPVTQEILFEEVKRIYPNKNEELSVTIIESMHYLRACIKESFRLTPITLGTSRVLPNDVILTGHRIPSGTFILAHNQVSSVIPEFVDQPSSFLPERWLREAGASGLKRPHPYLVLPFGAGPRSCIGRRLAELEMHTFLILLVRNFKIEWKGKSALEIETRMVNIPETPLEIALKVREE